MKRLGIVFFVYSLVFLPDSFVFTATRATTFAQKGISGIPRPARVPTQKIMPSFFELSRQARAGTLQQSPVNSEVFVRNFFDLMPQLGKEIPSVIQKKRNETQAALAEIMKWMETEEGKRFYEQVSQIEQEQERSREEIEQEEAQEWQELQKKLAEKDISTKTEQPFGVQAEELARMRQEAESRITEKKEEQKKKDEKEEQKKVLEKDLSGLAEKALEQARELRPKPVSAKNPVLQLIDLIAGKKDSAFNEQEVGQILDKMDQLKQKGYAPYIVVGIDVNAELGAYNLADAVIIESSLQVSRESVPVTFMGIKQDQLSLLVKTMSYFERAESRSFDVIINPSLKESLLAQGDYTVPAQDGLPQITVRAHQLNSLSDVFGVLQQERDDKQKEMERAEQAKVFEKELEGRKEIEKELMKELKQLSAKERAARIAEREKELQREEEALQKEKQEQTEKFQEQEEPLLAQKEEEAPLTQLESYSPEDFASAKKEFAQIKKEKKGRAKQMEEKQSYLQEGLKRLAKKLKKAEADNQTLQKAIAQKDSEKAVLQKKIEQLVDENAVFMDEFSQKSAEIAEQYKKEIAQVNQAARKEREGLQAMHQKQLEALRQESDQDKKQVREQLNAEVKRLKDEYTKQLQGVEKEYVKKAQELTAQFEKEKEQARIDFESKMQEVSQKVIGLQEQIAALTAQNNQKDEEVTRLNQAREQLEIQLDALQDQLQRQKDTLTREREEIVRQKDESDKRLQEAMRKLLETESERDGYVLQVNQQDELIGVQQARINDLVMQLDAFKKQMTDEGIKIKEETAQAITRAKQAFEDLQVQESQLREQEKVLAEQKEQALQKTVQAQSAELVQKDQQFQERARQFQNQTQGLEEQTRNLEKELERLTQELHTQKEASEKQQENAKREKLADQQQIQTLQAAIAQKDSEKAVLQKKIEQLVDENAVFMDEFSQKSAEIAEQYKKEIAQVNQAARKEREGLQAMHQKQLEALRQESDQDKKQVREQLNAEVKRLKNEHTKQLQGVEKEYVKKAQELAAEFEKEKEQARIEFESKMQEVSQKAIGLQEQIAALTAQNNQKDEEVTRLNQSHEQLKIQLDALQNQLQRQKDTLTREREEVVRQKDEFDKRLQEAMRKLLETEAERDGYVLQVNQQDELIGVQQARINDLVMQLDAFKKQMTDEGIKIKKETEQAITRAKQAFEDLQVQESQLREQEKVLAEQKEQALQKTVQAQSAELAQKDQQFQEKDRQFQNQTQGLEEQTRNLEKELERLTQELRTQKEAAEKQQTAAAQQQENAKREKLADQQQIQTLQKAIAQKDSEKAVLQQNIEQLVGENAVLQDRLQRLALDNDGLQKRVQVSGQEVADLKKQNMSFQQLLAELQLAQTQDKKRIQNQEQALNNADAQLDSQGKALQKQKDELARKSDQLGQMAQHNKDLELQLQRMRLANDDSAIKNKELLESLKKETKEKEQLLLRIAQLQDDLQAKETALQRSEQVQADQRVRSAREIVDLQQKNDQLVAQNDQQRKDFEAQMQQNQKQQAQLDGVIADLRRQGVELSEKSDRDIHILQKQYQDQLAKNYHMYAEAQDALRAEANRLTVSLQEARLREQQLQNSLKQDIANRDAQIALWKQKNGEIALSADQKQRDMQFAHDQAIAALTKQFDDYKRIVLDEKNQMDQQLAHIIKQRDELLLRVNDLEAALVKIRLDNDAKDQQIQDLDAQIQQLSDRIKVQQRQFGDREKAASEKIDALIKQMQQALQEKDADSAGQIQKLLEDNHAVERDYKKASRELVALQKRLEELSASLSAAEDVIVSMKKADSSRVISQEIDIVSSNLKAMRAVQAEIERDEQQVAIKMNHIVANNNTQIALAKQTALALPSYSAKALAPFKSIKTLAVSQPENKLALQSIKPQGKIDGAKKGISIVESTVQRDDLLGAEVPTKHLFPKYGPKKKTGHKDAQKKGIGLQGHEDSNSQYGIQHIANLPYYHLTSLEEKAPKVFEVKAQSDLDDKISNKEFLPIPPIGEDDEQTKEPLPFEGEPDDTDLLVQENKNTQNPIEEQSRVNQSLEKDQKPFINMKKEPELPTVDLDTQEPVEAGFEKIKDQTAPTHKNKKSVSLASEDNGTEQGSGGVVAKAKSIDDMYSVGLFSLIGLIFLICVIFFLKKTFFKD